MMVCRATSLLRSLAVVALSYSIFAPASVVDSTSVDDNDIGLGEKVAHLSNSEDIMDYAFAREIARAKFAFRGAGTPMNAPNYREAPPRASQKEKEKETSHRVQSAAARVQSVICKEEQFSNFCGILDKAGEDSGLLSGRSSASIEFALDFREDFTLFLPVNSAFDSPLVLPRGLSVEDFVNAHILNRAFSFEQLSAICYYKLPTRFPGESTMTRCDLDGTPMFQTGEGNTEDDMPHFVTELMGEKLVDIKSGHGFIHSIDGFIKTSQFLGTPSPTPSPTNFASSSGTTFEPTTTFFPTITFFPTPSSSSSSSTSSTSSTEVKRDRIEDGSFVSFSSIPSGSPSLQPSSESDDTSDRKRKRKGRQRQKKEREDESKSEGDEKEKAQSSDQPVEAHSNEKESDHGEKQKRKRRRKRKRKRSENNE